MNSLAGRCAVITGGASGIGRATVERMVKMGIDKLAVLDINDEGLKTVVAETDPERVFGFHCDISDPDSISSVFAEVRKAFPAIDILVNCAGGNRPGTFQETSLELLDFCYKLNLRSTFLCSKEVVDGMIARKYGRIINFGSAYGAPGFLAYTAAKGGITSMTRSMASELSQYGITINSVMPGLIATPILAKTGWTPEKQAEFLKTIPAGRLGTAEDIAAYVCFLSLVPREMFGRISGLVNAIMVASMPVSSFLCSLLAVRLSVTQIFCLFGLITMAVYLVARGKGAFTQLP